MYRWRSKAGLFTWGQSVGGRLGYSINEVEEEYRPDSQFRNGVCLPRSVPGMENLIVSDVVGFGYGFAILTAEGDVYKIGELQEYVPRGINRIIRPVPSFGPTVTPNIPLIGFQIPNMPQIRGPPAAHVDRPEATIHLEGDGGARFGEGPNEPENDLVDYVGSFTISEKAKVKKLDYYSEDNVSFVTISCGRSHILALDEDDNRIVRIGGLVSEWNNGIVGDFHTLVAFLICLNLRVCFWKRLYFVLKPDNNTDIIN